MMRLQKSHLILLAVLVLMLPWFKGGQEGIAVALDTVAVLLGGLMLWRQPKKLEHPRDVLMWSGLGLLAWGALSMIWTVNRFQTFGWVLTLAFGVITFLLAYQLQADEKLRHKLLDLYLGAAAIFGLFGFCLYWTDGYDRITSSFYWPNPFAAWLLPAIIIGGWWYAEKGRRQDLVTTVLVLAAFYLTFSRSSLLLLGLVIAVMAFTVRRKAKFWGRLGLMLVLTATVVFGANLIRKHLIYADVNSVSDRFAEAASGKSQSLSDRVYYLRSAVDIWKKAPAIGSGAGTYSTMHRQYQLRVISAAAHAHNVYAETLSELGVVGFLLLVLMMGSLVWFAWLGLKKDHWKLPLFVALVVLVVHIGLDFDTSYPAMVMLVAALGGLAVAPGKTVENKGFPLALALAALAVWPALSFYQSDLLNMRGHAAQDGYDYNEAISDFNQAHQNLVYDPDVLNAEGILYYTLAKSGAHDQIQDMAMAEQRAMAAIKLDGHDAQHPFLLARLYVLKGDNRKAEEAYRSAITLDPYNHPEYYEDLTALYLHSGDPQSAAVLARQALPQYTDDVLANRHLVPHFQDYVSSLWADLGTAELAMGQKTQAIADLKQAAHVNPYNHRALQLLVEIRKADEQAASSR